LKRARPGQLWHKKGERPGKGARRSKTGFDREKGRGDGGGGKLSIRHNSGVWLKKSQGVGGMVNL